MTNINLLYSSIFFGIILLYFCCKYNDNKLLIILTIVGIYTSILNHMYKNQCLQYLDRIIMIIGFIYLFIIKNNYQVLSLLLLTILLYFLAKYTENDLFHFYAHFLITITIILLLTNKI
jgi:membrane-bound ClpP family serine protease